jgi:ubiquitin conjugation factor E4 B
VPVATTKSQINISASGQSTPSKARSTPAAQESLDVWEDRTLGGIFRLTLDEKTRHDIHGHSLHYVGSVRDDLQENDAPIKLSTDVLDQAILEAASNLGKISPLDYLLACWKRVTRLLKSFKPAKPGDPKKGIIEEAKRLCMSYCIFAITMPDMFG